MLTSKQLNVKIKAFGKSNVSMRENFHTILKNCAAHAYEHGDVTGFDRVFEYHMLLRVGLLTYPYG